MTTSHQILILGASYGSLLGTKLALAGHSVTLVCLPEEVRLINADGARVRIPVPGREALVELDSRTLPGSLAAASPADVSPADFDLIALAMQEPQYRSPGARELTEAIATSGVPCMSIMNMPPLPFLARIPGLDCAPLRDCYTEPGLWQAFDPAHFTLASPDPQAFRPPDEPANVLQVSLPTNFKVARFESDAHTALLETLAADIQGARFDPGGGEIELPVKLRVHDSVFVPLAKWCMLLTGNYRCVLDDGARSICDAVHEDLDASRSMYEWVAALCRELGASASDQVPFEKYARAAQGLAKPSSAARALLAGAQNIERVDRVVQTLAAQRGQRSAALDAIVERVDRALAANRTTAA